MDEIINIEKMLQEIEHFREKHNLSKTKFCILAANNPRLLERINAGTITAKTIRKVYNFIQNFENLPELNTKKTG